jgi:hypothetical protein
MGERERESESEKERESNRSFLTGLFLGKIKR